MTAIPATCELWVDGLPYQDTPDPTAPVALTELRVTWGRTSTLDQPEPSGCSFLVLDPPGGQRFDQGIKLGSVVKVWTASGSRRALVFDGRVTDLEVTWAPLLGGALLQVICADAAADLNNRYVGDEPWPVENVRARAQRVLDLAGVDYPLVIDPRPAAVLVSRVDVDRRGAYGLLQELANTSAAIVRTTVTADGATQLYLQDPALRPALWSLTQDPPTDLWVVGTNPGAGQALSANEVLQDPTRWLRDTTDLITRASIRWLDQATMPDPTERTYTLVDDVAEVVWGARGLSVGTLLTTESDASALALGSLASHQPGDLWRSTALTWDLSATEAEGASAITLAMDLLDVRTRQGLPVGLVDLPDWTPTGAQTALYVEGGTYVYGRGADGAMSWQLAMDTVPAAGLGLSLTYGTVDRSIRCMDVDRSVRYLDMIGVGPRVTVGPSWADMDTIIPPPTWDTTPGSWYDWRDYADWQTPGDTP